MLQCWLHQKSGVMLGTSFKLWQAIPRPCCSSSTSCRLLEHLEQIDAPSVLSMTPLGPTQSLSGRVLRARRQPVNVS